MRTLDLLSTIHNHLGMTILVLLGLAIIIAVYKWTSSKSYKKIDKIIYLIAGSLLELQVLLGILLYIFRRKWEGFAEMDVDISRFFAVEHPLGMLIAVALVSIGRARSKRVEGDKKKHRTIAIFYGIGFLLLLLSIPWDFRF